MSCHNKNGYDFKNILDILKHTGLSGFVLRGQKAG
jgi:hypothetical protein